MQPRIIKKKKKKEHMALRFKKLQASYSFNINIQVLEHLRYVLQ